MVSGYPWYQPAGSFCLYVVYTHKERQAVVSGYPGIQVSRYQPGVSFCMYPYTYAGRQDVVSDPGYRSVDSVCTG